MLRGKDLLMEVLLRLVLKFKICLCSKRRSLIKFHLSYLRLMMRRWLSLQLKRERVETRQMGSLHEPSVERVILVNPCLEREIILVVVKVGTRLGISLI